MKDKEILKLYNRMDLNHDGALSRPEIIACLQSAGVELERIVNTLTDYGYNMEGWDDDDDAAAQQARKKMNPYFDASSLPPPNIHELLQHKLR